jgi:hypothetical protein
MKRLCAVVLTVGGLIIIAGSTGALISSSAEARGYVGPSPSSSHNQTESSPTFSPTDFGRARRVRRK